MKVLVIGATGNIGRVAASALEEQGHEVVRASRSSDPSVDLADTASIAALFASLDALDAVVVAAGEVPFKPVTELTREDYADAFAVKTLGQLDVVRHAFEHLRDGGSVTLTSGVLSREPIATASAAAAANGAIESFVTTAATEAPRGIRLNVVSPDVLENSPHHHATFPGHRPVSDAEVARAFVRAVDGVGTGRTISV
ncbi:short chain dehydrogenase [Brachybacterium fresconis]|uniref:NAD(P)-dependent dehydrogenase (Short-subunit alcohol dehydrogenase family) n=1 Tax=Brachybacterium fresconis TaxID=173363 RepID=A0ABS4YFW7_9MICO|nr:short chain dehydrogenase [Brachybacterium fresconis]MBP2407292.1 NAD(P)-dependent dehydrogenase (short-subunit alcohol dehydrogenase family) [Brachybacterium fresconis]